MEKNVRKDLYILLFIVMSVLYSCGKSLPEEELQGEHQIRFQLDGFNASVKPLSSKSRQASRSLANVVNRELYHWSFNQESLLPDVGVDKSSVSWALSMDKISYVTGKALEPYAAGRSLSLRGVAEFTLGMSIKDVTSLGELSFHLSGSDTGPKVLDLAYSIDGGATYVPLRTNFDFREVKSNSWGDLVQDLSKIDISKNIQKILFKFTLKNALNPTTGTFKIDNLRLTGVYNGNIEEGVPVVQKLHYHIFNEADGDLVTSGDVEVDAKSGEVELPISLNTGRYLVSFVLNQSPQPLTIPKTVKTIHDFYIYNAFDNLESNVFGATLSGLEIDGDKHVPITMVRYYSEVKFEFTDVIDLQKVASIQIAQEHSLPYYVPFVKREFPTLTDVSKISIPINFGTDNRSIQFNQFLGRLDQARDVAYKLSVYDSDEKLLREFSVTAAIKNNVQLTFKGNLLDGLLTDGKFVIKLDETWGGNVNQPF
jgi:hypothetical protein